MTPLRVEQFLPSFAPRDAVGNHTRDTAAALSRAGIGGAIWAEHVNPAVAAWGQHYQSFPAQPESSVRRLLLYQASTGSKGMAEYLRRRPEPLALHYHNITPAHYFSPYDPVAAEVADRGRRELRRLVPRVTLALADSLYNARELQELGIEDVRLMPPYTGPGIQAAPDPDHLQYLQRSKRGVDVLFVGRVAPNKGHGHLLRVAAALKAGSGQPVRFFVVGHPGHDRYLRELIALRRLLGLEDEFRFTWSLPQDKLAAHYDSADVYLCLSEHEGFGVPLLEAMRCGLPIVAYGAGAVPETLGRSGIVLGTLDPLVAAETVFRVTADEKLKEALRARQRSRMAELDGFDRDGVLLAAVRDLSQLWAVQPSGGIMSSETNSFD